MIAKDVINNAAIGGGGEKAYNLVRLRPPVKDIAKNLDPVQQYVADAVTEVGDQP